MVASGDAALLAGNKGLRIYTLGRFKVYNGDADLSAEYGTSKKVWDLFIYLITNRQNQLPPEVITETLWPEQDYNNPKASVKNLIHRLRKKLDGAKHPEAASTIIYNNGCYSWNCDSDYWLDVEEFEGLCRKASHLLESDLHQACAKYRQALSLYKGEYLAESPYSDWLLPVRHYYRHFFIESVTKMLRALKEQQQYSQMLEDCKKALFVEHYEEDIHLYYIEALLGEGKANQAREHYEYISTLLYREFGTKPSPAMRNLYRAIQQRSDRQDLKMNDIRDVLHERDESKGALYCEPEQFRFLCKMEKRRAAREDRPVHIGLLSLNDLDYRLPPADQLAEPMKHLSQVLSRSLRKGDIYSDWNEGQYAMLLPGTTREQAETVLERAGSAFRQEYPPHKLVLRSSVHSLLPFEYL